MRYLKIIGSALSIILIAAVIGSCGPKKTKNVIFILPDGLSNVDQCLARWYNGGTLLAADPYAVGLVRTFSANNLVTDSAASGSAYATGHKLSNETVAVMPAEVTIPVVEKTPPGDENRPIASIIEAARLAGLSTGIITNDDIVGASPCDFGAHAASRDDSGSLAEQMVYSNVDVIMAGAPQYLVPGKEDGNREDGEDLIKEAKNRGYEYASNKAELDGAHGSKILCVMNECAAEFDRKKDEYPSLAEMTQKAIDVLSENDEGFFLFVEESQIDWFGHDNDPIGVISETLEFNETFKVCLDFAKKDGNTTVIACADHSTGGLHILENEEDLTSLDGLQSVFGKAKRTGYGADELIGGDTSKTAKILAEYYGLTDLTKDELNRINQKIDDNPVTVFGPMLAKRGWLSFASDDHTGEDVVLYGYSPSGYLPTDFAESGIVNNIQINQYMQNILHLDLNSVSKRLFVSQKDIESKGIKVSIDKSNSKNLVIILEKNGKAIQLPVDKSVAIVDGKTVDLEGVTLYIDSKIWVSQSAIDLL